MCACSHVYAGGFACILHAYVQGPEVNLRIIPQALLVFFGGKGGSCFVFVKIGFLIGLELTKYARLASQWAPGVCLPLPPQF